MAEQQRKDLPGSQSAEAEARRLLKRAEIITGSWAWIHQRKYNSFGRRGTTSPVMSTRFNAAGRLTTCAKRRGKSSSRGSRSTLMRSWQVSSTGKPQAARSFCRTDQRSRDCLGIAVGYGTEISAAPSTFAGGLAPKRSHHIVLGTS